MKYILLLTISLIASGCYTGIGQHSSKFNKVSLGMSKGEVIDAIGKPQSTRAANGVEYMTYNVYEVVFGQYVPYFVRIKNGKVDAYGKMGDFNSSKDPTMNINLDAKVKVN
jgi:hypothetical protein